MTGMLYLVATPIGNLKDISPRALQVLGEVDMVAAEDTRRTGSLLKAHGITKPLISCYAHNEERQTQAISRLLNEGKSVALVSDAGMPGISDPGARVVRMAVREGIELTVIPGPSAAITALAASGFDYEGFAFGGFFPRQSKEKKQWLAKYGSFDGALVFFESPKRLLSTLELIKEVLGDRDCCVARELTKRFEEFIRGSVAEVIEALAKKRDVKGEIVVVLDTGKASDKSRPVGNRSLGSLSSEAVAEICSLLLDSGLGKKEASRRLAGITGISPNECYKMMTSDR